MKKRFNQGYFGIMVLMAAGFAACNADDDDAPVNPTYDGESVKTHFSIALPQYAEGTRMGEDVVQGQTPPVFRGMEKITLLQFERTSGINTEATRHGSNITLSDIDPDGSMTRIGDANTKLYDDVSIAVGTGSVLFYGKAIDVDGGPTTDAGKHKYGVLKTDLNHEPTAIVFELEPIYTNGETSTLRSILRYLNSIKNTEITVGSATIKWNEEYNGALALRDIYRNFIGKTTSASSSAIKYTVKALYKLVNEIDDPMAEAIKANILTYGSTVYATADAAGNIEFTDEGNAALGDYPAEINLPEGAVSIKYVDGAFVSANSSSDGLYSDENDTPAALRRYTYPPSLWYTLYSGIRTSNESQAALFSTSTDNWTSVLAGYSGDKVLSSTHSVAITKPVQYAVGHFEFMLRMDNVTTLKDADGNDVPVPEAGFPVTAVLVGKQHNVDFQFKPITTSLEYTIYDNDFPAPVAFKSNVTTGVCNHTLVLETPKTESVKVALELQNTSGMDFYGTEGGIIPAGAKFYMVGELDPDSTDPGHITNDTGRQTVFEQDYITTATFTLTSLANAHYVIPDLRAEKLELGLSVDLEWQSGMSFAVELK